MPSTLINNANKIQQSNWCCRRPSPNTFNQIRPILQTIKVFGAFPYGTSSQGVKSSGKWEYMWAAGYLIFYSIPPVILIINIQFVPTHNILDAWKNIIVAVFLVKECLFYAAIFLDTLNCFYRNRLTITFFERLEKFDKEARRLGHPREEKNVVYWMLTIIGIASVLVISVYALTRCFTKPNGSCPWEISLSRIVLELAHSHLTLKWIIYINMIHQRIKHLNDVIISNLSFQPVFYNRSHAVVTHDIVSLYSNLIEIVKIFNRLASLIMLLSLSALLVNTLLHTKTLTGRHSSLLIGLLTLNSFVQLIALCYICSITVNEANDTGSRFTVFQTTLNDSTAIEEKMGIAMQLFHNEIAFSGGDMFDIDLYTFRGILLVLISFIVIISDMTNTAK